jgi:protease-4
MSRTMTDDTSGKPKRSLFRKILLLLGIGIGLLLLVNILFPDLDLSMEDRVELIRVEGVILDAHSTVAELKRFGENPSV